MNIEKIQINAKPRKLKAKWTVTLGHGETEISEDLSRQIQEEIDWEIMCDMMRSMGWTVVKMPWDGYMTDSDAHVLKEWCTANLQGNYNARGNTWVFEKEKDASMFILRWV